ncbi:MAG: DUF6864 domain-containing function [Myxococcota bacterium]
MTSTQVSTVVRGGSAIVVSSGQATTFEGAPLDVSVQMLDGSVYILKFECAVDPQVSGIQITSELHPWGVHLNLVNFDEGRGSATPVELGVLGEHRFYVHFRVHRFGRTLDHTVQWTFFAVAL